MNITCQLKILPVKCKMNEKPCSRRRNNWIWKWKGLLMNESSSKLLRSKQKIHLVWESKIIKILNKQKTCHSKENKRMKNRHFLEMQNKMIWKSYNSWTQSNHSILERAHNLEFKVHKIVEQTKQVIKIDNSLTKISPRI